MFSNILLPTHNFPCMFYHRWYIYIIIIYLANVLQIFFKCSTNLLKMIYKYSSNVLQIFYKCSTNILQMFYKSSTNLLQIFYKSSANVLFTNLLYWLIFISRLRARVPNGLTNQIRSHSKKSHHITEHSGEKPHTVDNRNIIETSVICICQNHA